ncbi:MAG: putative Lycopene cyclase [Polaromonas sp.]|nr:putative Lycopene cyclase [Polaromonas sp.]
MTPAPLRLLERLGAHLPEGTAAPRDADLILAGGGLANGLIAWRLAQARPGLRILLLESGSALGGNHTWSFHDGDLTPAQHAWLAPLVAHRWAGHSVKFPGGERRLATGYASVTSSRFDAVLRSALPAQVQVRFGAPVAWLTASAVTLASGEVLRAGAVIDGRGLRPSPHLSLGYQKFLGQELRLDGPHGLSQPVLMDATVKQHGGYRFIYLLPFSADTLLVEDTCYADDELLDADRLRAGIADYAQARGWTVAEVLREERGVLPITLDGDIEAYWREAHGVARAGLAAGLFHATTGYSLPSAVRLADLIASLPDLSSAPLFDAIRGHALAQWRAQGFFRLLNRMLFRACAPGQRWRVMQRFYGLPAPLIERFYAARLGLLDKARLLAGKPPVPVGAAWRASWPAPAGQGGGLAGSAAREDKNGKSGVSSTSDSLEGIHPDVR